MRTNGKRLLHLPLTSAAHLAGSSRVDFHHGNTGSFSSNSDAAIMNLIVHSGDFCLVSFAFFSRKISPARTASTPESLLELNAKLGASPFSNQKWEHGGECSGSLIGSQPEPVYLFIARFSSGGCDLSTKYSLGKDQRFRVGIGNAGLKRKLSFATRATAKDIDTSFSIKKTSKINKALLICHGSPLGFTLFKASVVESAVSFKHNLKLTLLVAIGIDPELECLSHLFGVRLEGFEVKENALKRSVDSAVA